MKPEHAMAKVAEGLITNQTIDLTKILDIFQKFGPYVMALLQIFLKQKDSPIFTSAPPLSDEKVQKVCHATGCDEETVRCCPSWICYLICWICDLLGIGHDHPMSQTLPEAPEGQSPTGKKQA